MNEIKVLVLLADEYIIRPGPLEEKIQSSVNEAAAGRQIISIEVVVWAARRNWLVIFLLLDAA